MTTMTAAKQDRASAFLDQSPIPLYIGGRWQPATGGETIEVLQPSDGAPLATVAGGGAADIDAAVKAAWAAFPAWAATPANDRAVLLHRLADAIDKNVETIAKLESLDVGKPYIAARDFDIPFASQAYRYYADLSVHARRNEPIGLKGIEARQIRVPYGPCGFIVPWNFPFVLFAWGAAPALAAGNTIVVKPAELTPLTSLFMGQLAEEVGFPRGVINVVPGLGETAGSALANHSGIKRMSFTGSPEVGKLVAEACGRNLVPCKLELGGKGAAVVFEDVDVKATAQALASAITGNTGQVCCTATRWMIHEKIYDQLISEASAALKKTKIGPGMNEDTQMGPVVSATQRSRVLGYLEKGTKTGAKFILEGGPAQVPGHEGGYFVKPALLTGPADNVCNREEIFGPVAYVLPFKDEEKVIADVNSSPYGLANSVWSGDLNRANRVAERLVAGNSWINAHNVFAYGLPYPGVNLSGIGGGVNSPECYYDYLRHQTIARPLA
jgi:acyl-CoA reductase-like NAD-dependent aldehyde dehydrogenase